MEVSIQTEKRKKNQPPPPTQPEQEDPHQQNEPTDEQQKDRKIRKLTQVNRELIEKLKSQNEELTKKINKQKLKPARSTSVRVSPKNTKQIESTKKQLTNAYRQIDMYKSVIMNLKAKEISIDSVDKINQLENKIKYQEGIIDQLQKEIKYLGTIKDQQEKELKIYQNEQVKNSVADLEKQVNTLKEKIKTLKKNAQKRDQIEKKQHTYQIQLQRALRKLNDQYYPGKVEQKKNNNEQVQGDISEKQWQTAKTQLAELRKTHQDNQKKIDNIIRQKNKQLKSAEQNELKIKEKSRKLQTLKNKLTQLSKLVTVRESTTDKKGLKQEVPLGHSNNGQNANQQEKLTPKEKAQKKAEESRQVKKWMIPQGYCLQKGKILPDSIFFSDKTLLKQSKKSKIVEVNIWHNTEEIPCLLQFNYKNENNDELQGNQPVPNAASALQMVVFKMKESDYLHKIKGYFLDGELVGIQLISKFGKQFSVESQTAKSQGQPFSFEPRPNEIPSCVFGAYVRNSNDQVRVCHLGFEFITDW